MNGKKRWVIRLAIDRSDDDVVRKFPPELVESLRYAGVVKVPYARDMGGALIVDVLPPSGVVGLESTQQWAKSNAERMTGFGYNAVAAPEWKEA